MKKLAFTLLLAVSFLAVKAQETKTGIIKIDVSVGAFSSNDALLQNLDYDNYYYDPITLFPFSTTNYNTYPIAARVTFFEYKKIAVGMGFGYQQMSGDITYYEYDDINMTSNYYEENASISIFTIMPEVRFNWVTAADNSFQLYSGVNFGLDFVTEKHDSNTDLNKSYRQPGFHVNGIGLRFGKKVGGFMEVGLGNRGFISAGLSVAFQ